MTASELRAYRPRAELLKNRVVLITGAANGIGKALSLGCAAHGATVVLLDKVIRQLEVVYDAIEAAGHPQPGIYPMNLEGATPKDYDDLAENLEAEFGRLDGLVHNAAWVGALTPFKHYDVELWSRVITTNLHAPFMLTRATLPLLEAAPDASIVFSTHDCQRAYWGAFGVAKAAQAGMLQILSHEYRGTKKIRVNGIDTGPARTQMRAQNYPGEDPGIHPAPEELIWPYLYFLGPDAGESTGENVALQP